MNFEFSEDQIIILSELEKLCAPFTSVSVSEVVQRHVFAPTLQNNLIESGYLDLGVGDRDSATSSALIVSEIAALPVVVECAGSALVRSALAPQAEAPVALIHGDGRSPTRFLPQAKTVFWIQPGSVHIIRIEDGDVEALPSLFGYPMGRLNAQTLARAERLDDALVEPALRWWRVGIGLEIAGALASCMKLTVEHVTDRQQFGRPLGSFQAIQHRLAVSATHTEACRWLALRAANTWDPVHAMVAAGYAQNAVRSVTYDCHQFSGAMGLTLEYSLHLFSYRAKLLQSELGGADDQFLAASDLRWGEPAQKAA